MEGQEKIEGQVSLSDEESLEDDETPVTVRRSRSLEADAAGREEGGGSTDKRPEAPEAPEAEKRLFDEHPKQNWLVWKTRPCCITTPFHENKKDSCPYAHGAADAWCLICNMDGHFTDDCPYKIN